MTRFLQAERMAPSLPIVLAIALLRTLISGPAPLVGEAQAPRPVAGETIAFVSDRDDNNEIYVMDAAGAAAFNLTNHPADDRQPSWSPDGRMIAFASDRDDDSFDIYVITIETGELTRLTEPGSEYAPGLVARWPAHRFRLRSFRRQRHHGDAIGWKPPDSAHGRRLRRRSAHMVRRWRVHRVCDGTARGA